MSLRFIDSFDHYSTADLLGTGNGQKWSGTSVVTSQILITGPGRFNNCLQLSTAAGGNPSYIYKVLDNQSTWVIGFAFKIVNLSSAYQLLALYDSATVQVDLRINTLGQLYVTRNGTTIATSTNTISINTWYYIEYLVTISASITTNQWQVNVNGSNWINVAAGQSSKNSGNTTANTIYIGLKDLVGSSSTQYIYYDDLYICDGTGSTNNTFLGDVRVECRFPSAPSATNTNWLASTGTTTGCISDLTPNGDNSYIYSATTNDISTFTVPALVSTPSTIFGVQLTHSSRKTDAGTRQVSDAVRSGTTNYFGTTVNLSTSYIYYSSIYQTDPNTSAAWTASAVNAVEIGVKEIT